MRLQRFRQTRLGFCLFVLQMLLTCGCSGSSAETGAERSLVDSSSQPDSLQFVGIRTNSHTLRVLTQRLLELEVVQPKAPGAGLRFWNFSSGLPAPEAIKVTVNGARVPVTRVGFKQRVVYAPLKQYDLRVGGWLYVELSASLKEGDKIAVAAPQAKSWPATFRFEAAVKERRLSPVLHVNQVGYAPKSQKKAFAGYYLGSLGELDIQAVSAGFSVLDHAGRTVHLGKFVPSADKGFPGNEYQRVFEADFSSVTNPGTYSLFVEGLGQSFPFSITEAFPAIFARTYALGTYHQRCGAANELPYTRFTHGPCHTAPAQVPTTSPTFEAVNNTLKGESGNAKDNPRHSAPQLASVSASLYPFINKGPVAVHGGHHDAGDYSKYTINSAGFIHHLVFAADCFAGVAALDNLGMPESGDGKSDVLQIAKWEADFLARMQDADGGFYFLVYPRDRRYEDNVLPDKGDPQVVFPKTTSVTAAAAAALAQCASSPAFKAQFPSETKKYLESARKGWAFLLNAIAQHGKDGAYQKITHYGDEFMHDDELAWAACEMYLATRDPQTHAKAREWLRPADPATRKWGWLRLYDAYGCAIRSYAFGEKSRRVRQEELDTTLFEQCLDEIAFAGQDQLSRCRNSAYGVSFPEETKRARSAGWFFAADPAFELATACQLDFPSQNDPRPAMLEAILSNFNYEAGANPVNVAYLTGTGVKRQREIVHQYAQNDVRLLPPSGVPLGCIQGGISWLHVYKDEPTKLSYPSDGAESGAYPFYDRWSDAFNLSQEFVILHQARGLAVWAWLMARSPAAQTGATPPKARMEKTPTGIWQLAGDAAGLEASQVIWESPVQGAVVGSVFPFAAPGAWLEVEALLKDGRRIFARTNLVSAR